MRTRDPLPQLTSQYFQMAAKLELGYPTHRDKLNNLFFNPTDLPAKKTVILSEFISPDRKVSDKPAIPKDKTYSSRLFVGRITAQVIYPSGAVHDARLRVLHDLCAIEPVAPNTAFFITDRGIVENSEVIDLRKIDHIRQYHTRQGRAFLSEFR